MVDLREEIESRACMIDNLEKENKRLRELAEVGPRVPLSMAGLDIESKIDSEIRGIWSYALMLVDVEWEREEFNGFVDKMTRVSIDLILRDMAMRQMESERELGVELSKEEKIQRLLSRINEIKGDWASADEMATFWKHKFYENWPPTKKGNRLMLAIAERDELLRSCSRLIGLLSDEPTSNSLRDKIQKLLGGE